jgi:hypothetical protein
MGGICGLKSPCSAAGGLTVVRITNAAGQTVTVYENPIQAQFDNFKGYQLRGINDGTTLRLWDSCVGEHFEVAKKLGIQAKINPEYRSSALNLLEQRVEDARTYDCRHDKLPPVYRKLERLLGCSGSKWRAVMSRAAPPALSVTNRSNARPHAVLDAWLLRGSRLTSSEVGSALSSDLPDLCADRRARLTRTNRRGGKEECSRGEKKMMERVSRGQRMYALRRLLVYARAESEELGLSDLDKLLGAAALAVSDELDSGKAVRSHRASKREVRENADEEASKSADEMEHSHR